MLPVLDLDPVPEPAAAISAVAMLGDHPFQPHQAGVAEQVRADLALLEVARKMPSTRRARSRAFRRSTGCRRLFRAAERAFPSGQPCRRLVVRAFRGTLLKSLGYFSCWLSRPRSIPANERGDGGLASIISAATTDRHIDLLKASSPSPGFPSAMSVRQSPPGLDVEGWPRAQRSRYDQRMTNPILLALTLAMMMTGGALAEQRTFYNSSGKVVGRSSTNSSGTTTIYDSRGRVISRESTSGNRTTIYDAAGRLVGRWQ